MKYEYAGITIDLPGIVIVVDMEAARPVFHRTTGLRTSCGAASLWEAGRTPRFFSPVASKHAVKFARPCATCWPELRAQPSLFMQRHRQPHPEQSVLA